MCVCLHTHTHTQTYTRVFQRAVCQVRLSAEDLQMMVDEAAALRPLDDSDGHGVSLSTFLIIIGQTSWY